MDRSGTAEEIKYFIISCYLWWRLRLGTCFHTAPRHGCPSRRLRVAPSWPPQTHTDGTNPPPANACVGQVNTAFNRDFYTGIIVFSLCVYLTSNHTCIASSFRMSSTLLITASHIYSVIIHFGTVFFKKDVMWRKTLPEMGFSTHFASFKVHESQSYWTESLFGQTALKGVIKASNPPLDE